MEDKKRENERDAFGFCFVFLLFDLAGCWEHLNGGLHWDGTWDVCIV